MAKRLARKRVVRKREQKKAAPRKTAASDLTTQNKETRATLTKLFIRQSWRSNYCAVYSAGMLLSLLGYPTTRKQALRLFGLKASNNGYDGTTHQLISTVISSAADVGHCRWKYCRQFSFYSVLRTLRYHFTHTPQPTLISFGVVHKNGIWRSRHTALVVGITNGAIELLDPLANPPRKNDTSNVSLRPHKPIFVIGNSYTIDVRSEVGVLHWLPK